MKKIALFLFIIGLLTACGSTQSKDVSSTPISVDFSYQPEQVKVGEVTTLQVLVKQGNDLVSDANDVKFEVWKDGQEKHEIFSAESKGKGVYTAPEKFSDNGTYHVMYHVTARGMHKMTQNDIQVK